MFLQRLLTATFFLTAAVSLYAQQPERIQITDKALIQRSVLDCAAQFAGSTKRVLAPGAKTSDKHFLCLGDSLLIQHNGDQNLSGYGNQAAAGIAYPFYDCPPTQQGPNLSNVQSDRCLDHNVINTSSGPQTQTNGMWIARGTQNGNITFNNNGALQKQFGNGTVGPPVKFYYAPITIENFANKSWTGDACVNVNVSDATGTTDTFSVVYLNAISHSGLLSTTGKYEGSFVVNGGLPEYDGSTFTIDISLASDASVKGTVTSGVSRNGMRVVYTVPKAGDYNVVITDGKSCDDRFKLHVQDVTVVGSKESGKPGDTVCVAITASKFTNITTAQGDFTFDPTVVQFVRAAGFNLPGLDATGFSAQAGSVSFTWANADPAKGINKADGETLFTLCFKIVGAVGTSTLIDFKNVGTPVEVRDTGVNPLIVFTQSGSVTVGADLVALTVKTDSASCASNSDGKLKIYVSGTSNPPYNYTWKNTAGASGSGVLNNAKDSAIITGLPAGNYTVSVTSQTGKMQTSAAQILAPAPLFVNPPTAVNPKCSGDSNGSLTLTNYGGGTPPYSFKWSTGATTAAITNIPQGSYSVTLTDAHGCSSSGSGSIGVNPITITDSLADASCKSINNGSVSVTQVKGGVSANGSYTFNWSTGATSSGPAAALPNLAGGTYRLTVSDDNGCRRVDSFTINLKRTLILSAVVSPVACYGKATGSVNVSLATQGTSALPYSFTWSPNAGAPVNNATTSLINLRPKGVYNVSAQDKDGCRVDTSFSIGQPDSIKIDTQAGNFKDISCLGAGSDGAITISVQGGTPVYHYAWSRTAADTFSTISNLAQGKYTISVTDQAGCSNSKIYTVSAPKLPTIDSFSIKSPTCFGSNNGKLDVVAHSNSSSPIAKYLWSNGATTRTVDNVGAGVYKVTVALQNGCTQTASVTVAAPDALTKDTARFGVVQPHCPKEPSGVITFAVKGGTAPYTYQWSGGATANNPVFAQVIAGNYRFTVTDANKCAALTDSVVLKDPPSINITYSNIGAVSCNGKCSPGDGKATVTASGGTANTGTYNFSWASDNVNKESGSGSAFTFTKLCQGWQKIVISDSNCGTVDSVKIPAPDSLSLRPVITQPACNGDANGSAEVKVSGGTPPYQYNWNTGATTTGVYNVKAGKYNVQLSDARLCTFNLTVVVNQPDSLHIDTIAALTNQITCFGLSNGQIALQRFGGNGGPETYTWANNISTNNVASNLKAGNYSVTVTDPKGCRDSLNYAILQPDPIGFILEKPQAPTCNGDFGIIKVDTVYGGHPGSTFTISVDNAPGVRPGFEIPVFAGTRVITVQEDGTGCSVDTTVSIKEPPAIAVTFDTTGSGKPGQTPLILVELGKDMRLNPIVTHALPIDSVTYTWAPANGPSYLTPTGDPLRPYTRPLDLVTYTLTVRDVNGCLGSGQVIVDVDRVRNVYVPNIFSPDAKNNENAHFSVFTGPGVSLINYVRVFDRWGEMIYNAEKITPGDSPYVMGWDGTFNGKKSDSGVYVYLIEALFEDGVARLYRGSVTLIR